MGGWVKWGVWLAALIALLVALVLTAGWLALLQLALIALAFAAIIGVGVILQLVGGARRTIQVASWAVGIALVAAWSVFTTRSIERVPVMLASGLITIWFIHALVTAGADSVLEFRRARSGEA